MNESILTILRDPDTHDALELRDDSLLNPKTGKRFAIREGIPVFVETAAGRNKKYQEFYDRIAWMYDAGETLMHLVRPKADFRAGFLKELEIRPGARVLEVSVGTGANLARLPADIEFFGLDLSWGMLRRCRKHLAKWKCAAELFQGEAERLPFRDAAFDVVFHAGGFNFFADRAQAVREMIRVAKPGTKIAIADETEKVVKHGYEKMPVVRKYYKGREETVVAPTEFIPPECTEIQTREFFGGRLYCLTFRTPQ
ncbi:MAG: class I SAM-dependent methyltransferase [Candidatus Acidiferrales bacterium]